MRKRRRHDRLAAVLAARAKRARTRSARLLEHRRARTCSAGDGILRTRAPAREWCRRARKPAGMLALATLHDWPLEGSHELSHPVQQRVLRTLAAWSEMPATDIRVAVDGCGLPTFALPLERVACARFAMAATDRTAKHLTRGFPGLSDSQLNRVEGSPAISDAASIILNAMTTHPEYVAGTGR